MTITRPIVTFALLFVLTAAAVTDRVIWVQQVSAEINTANVSVRDTNCAPSSWLEVAPGRTKQAVRYRCGIPLWPFYASGESQEAATVLERSTSTL